MGTGVVAMIAYSDSVFAYTHKVYNSGVTRYSGVDGYYTICDLICENPT